MSTFIRIVITIVILIAMMFLKGFARGLTGTATGGFWGMAVMIIGLGAIFAMWKKDKKNDHEKDSGDETSILQK